MRSKTELTTIILRKAEKNLIKQILVSQVKIIREGTSPHTKFLKPKAARPLLCKWR